MSPFRRLAREMLHQPAALAWAMLFAFISAAGLGVGLLSLAPILKIILSEEHRSLVQLAQEANARDPWIRIPQGLIDRLPTDPFAGVALVITALLGLTLVGATANFLHQYLTAVVSTKTVGRIRSQVFERAVHLPLGRVVERGPSEFVARVVRDSSEIQRGFIALTSKTIGNLLKGLAALATAVVMQPVLTLVAIPTAVIVGAVLRALGKRIHRGARGSLQAQERLLRVATEALQGLRAVKASTAEEDVGRRFDEINRDVVHHELKVRTTLALSSPLLETIATFILAGLALAAAALILRNLMPFDRFLYVLLALGMAGASFRPLAGLVAEIQAASAPARRLCDLLDEPREEEPGAPQRRLPRHAREVSFESVTFTYAGADTPALRDVTLKIEHGRRVALVGPNGSGKTTLVSLLPRLLVPDSGCVRVDGVDVASVSLASLRGQIGVVTQETVLFRVSIAENLALGVEGASRERLVEAARRAHAHEFISQLPDGYDTNLAEQGASLSGGQRQRLAIARAILRDPALLILDEATSQIDAESEAHINAALADFCAGRTSIIVAHRLATVLNADRIVVMDAGRIVDAGRHDELLGRCGLYRRLTETQLVAVGEGMSPPWGSGPP